MLIITHAAYAKPPLYAVDYSDVGASQLSETRGGSSSLIPVSQKGQNLASVRPDALHTI